MIAIPLYEKIKSENNVTPNTTLRTNMTNAIVTKAFNAHNTDLSNTIFHQLLKNHNRIHIPKINVTASCGEILSKSLSPMTHECANTLYRNISASNPNGIPKPLKIAKSTNSQLKIIRKKAAKSAFLGA